MDGTGGETNPVTARWQRAEGQQDIMPRPPQPMNKAWYILPDFFDDMISNYFKFQQGNKTGGA